MTKLSNIEGQTFGKLTVSDRSDKVGGSGEVKWNCTCWCGKKVEVLGTNLRRGATTSCGCSRKKWVITERKHNEN